MSGQARTGFSSAHPGGAFFALADGTIKFIAENIEFDHKNQIAEDDIVDTVFEQLLSRDDGQTVKIP